MRYIYLLIILMCFSCNNERSLQLSEIKNAEVTEVIDISPAYIFYDETQPDSTFLNRKNLISTTNWLVNVDKRLTLRQAIPHIKFMQNKKRNAKMHKNENAKNFFTCNDTSIGSLGFIEFTDINYEFSKPKSKSSDLSKILSDEVLKTFDASTGVLKLPIIITEENLIDFKNKINTFLKTLKHTSLMSEEKEIPGFSLSLYFKEDISFQDYISIKSELLKLKSDKVRIDNNEFIY